MRSPSRPPIPPRPPASPAGSLAQAVAPQAGGGEVGGGASRGNPIDLETGGREVTPGGSSTGCCRSSLLGFGAPGATQAPGTAPGRSRAAQEQRRPRLKVGLLAEMRARGPGRDGQLIRPPNLQRARESRLRRHLPCRRCARMWLSGGCEVCSQAPDHSRARARVEARPWSGRSAASERELGFGFFLESTVAHVLVPF